MESVKNRIKNIHEAEEFLEGIPQFSGEETGFKYGVDRARLLLEFLDHPDKELKIIHVAGSNGKGSVCALLDTALRASGFNTGLFTSPHLTNIRERIRFCGGMIGEEDFVRLLNKVINVCENLREKHPGFTPAYFEYFFVIALLYYREKKADFVLLETGLGGRLDATNACERPVLCVITPVYLEHTGILGDTIEEIAAEKSGIMKTGVPVMVTDEDEGALREFRKASKESGSPLYIFRKESVKITGISDENIDFSLHNEYYRNVTVSLPIPAIYEALNAGIALSALGVLAEKGISGMISPEEIPAAFSDFTWPGRMERIGEAVYVDGAHNAAGIRAFTDSCAAFARGKRNVLLFAVSDDKDKKEMVRLLCESGLFAEAVVTSFCGERSAGARDVAALFRDMGNINAVTAEDVTAACKTALSLKHDYIFCTGSLYLAGEIKMSDITLFEEEYDDKF